jgi:hypothetical protein
MLRVLGLLVGCILALSSCTQRLICPAYQSAFIYDQEALRKQFSYFKEDSTPKILTVSRDKYLIIPESSYRKKIRSMQTIQMKPVYVKLPDSLQAKNKKKDEVLGAEQDATDSTAVKKTGAPEDSTYAITKDKELRLLKYDWDSLKYNVVNVTLNADQDNYMWYFRDVLVLPDVRAAMQDEKNAKNAKAADAKAGTKGEKKGFFGFFKNLFKKKAKPDSTATVVPQPNQEPLDSDSTTVTPPPQEKPVVKKKGFGLFKKKGNKDKKEEQKKDPAKKEDDGF